MRNCSIPSYMYCVGVCMLKCAELNDALASRAQENHVWLIIGLVYRNLVSNIVYDFKIVMMEVNDEDVSLILSPFLSKWCCSHY